MNERYPVLSTARYLLYGLAVIAILGGLCGGIATVGDAGAAGFLGVLVSAIFVAVMLVIYAELVGLALALERNTRQSGEASEQVVNLLRTLNASQQEMYALQKQIYNQPGHGGELTEKTVTMPPPSQLPADAASSSPPRTPAVPSSDATTRTSTGADTTRSTSAVPRPGAALPSTTDLQEMMPNLPAEDAIRMAQEAIQVGRFTDAAELLTRALTLEPPFMEAYPLRAEVFRQLGELQRAEADMETYRRLTAGG